MQNFNGEALHFNAAGRLKKAVDQLIGICSGLIADGELNDAEIAFLATWLADHKEVCGEFPGLQVSRRLKAVLADGVITPDERADLAEVLQQISGNRFFDTGAAEADGPAIPADPSPSIVFAEKRFCFTGKFAFGTRKKCTDAVEEQGGFCDGDVTKSLDYLVLGVGVSKDWKHETYGRKIEHALKLRGNKGTRPAIVSESDWIAALG